MTTAATDGAGLRVEHGDELVRRFAGEHAARILPSLIRTEARDWPPMLNDAVRHALRQSSASMTLVKGTPAVASPRVRGTIRGRP
jgi:hypothetical protein